MIDVKCFTLLAPVVLFLVSTSAFAADRPKPPDSMLGLTVGQQFSSTGFSCAADGCTKPAALAGVSGIMSVHLCNNNIHFIAWAAYDSTEALSKAQLETIAGPMLAAGWVTRDYNGIPFDDSTYTSITVALVAPDGRERTLTIAHRETKFTIVMSTSADGPCTEGLGL